MLKIIGVKEHQSFGPDELKVLTTAFDAALFELGLNRADPAALSIAKRMMALAQEGERDATRLRESVIEQHLSGVTQRSAFAHCC
jgi:hypothetical protein